MQIMTNIIEEENFVLSNNPKIKVIDPANDPTIESHTKAILNMLNAGGGKPLEDMQPGEARALLETLQSSVEIDLSGIDVSEKTITQDGITVKIYIVKPSGIAAALPVFMFFRGGGWVLGNFNTHKRLVRDLVVMTGTAAVFPEYSLSPEVHYPVAINEAYAATKWIAENGPSINVDSSRLAIVGDSVGGNMAAVVALMAKNKKGPEIKIQVLLWPATDASFETVSYNQYAAGRFLTKEMMQWFWDHYTTDESQRNEIYASPLRASLEELRGLPPALVQTAEQDVLRDEGEAYARKLDQAGVPVTLARYQGMIHGYGVMNLLAHVPAVKASLLHAAAQIKQALQ